jgi:hypothetical protein
VGQTFLSAHIERRQECLRHQTRLFVARTLVRERSKNLPGRHRGLPLRIHRNRPVGADPRVRPHPCAASLRVTVRGAVGYTVPKWQLHLDQGRDSLRSCVGVNGEPKMSELVADCPRCGAHKMTFDVTQELLVRLQYNWQQWYEAFCVCRNCRRATIFVLSQNTTSDSKVVQKRGIVNLSGSVNPYMDVNGYISLKDTSAVAPPEHLPAEIEAAFKEAATCLSVGCYNAAGVMFRLCVDLATRSKLPEEGSEGLTARVRRNLGLRLPWLFEHKHLPEALQELSHCVKEDGNDGAHAGSLQKKDAEDLLDFAVALLERLYTEPERLRLARERRDARRDAPAGS